MTLRSRLGRFFRTTAVRLTLVYLLLFAGVTVFMVVFVTRSTTDLLTRQLRTTIDADVEDIEEVYEQGGFRRVLTVIDLKSREPGASLYAIVDFSGNVVAGNVADLPQDILGRAADEPVPTRYTRLDGDQVLRHDALVRVVALDNGFRVLIGRDIGERERFREIYRNGFRVVIIVMLVLGLVTWFFVSNRVLKRIDQVTATSRKIVAGDLTGRLPVAGSGDEFDRLAESVNGMLSRIEDLMRGLKDVSDNIAHDLKTPLTRMRNRVEGALAAAPDETNDRAVLDATIEECDGLIKTFDALLMIARVEAGNQPAEMVKTPVGDIVREVAELYGPVTEEEGFGLEVVDQGGLAMVNRELLARALANLIDNALKYGRAEGRRPTIRVSVVPEGDDVVLSVTDNGPGVPEADRERVLGRFVRLEASRSAPGSGLGLALVQAIAHLHGTSAVLSDAEPGLKVSLRLKRA
jgi:signal transduction histidine kinase